MNAYRTLVTGLRRTLAVPGVILWLYAINLVCVLPLALGFSSTFSTAVGNSLELSSLTAEFDFSVIGDYLRNHGPEFSAAVRPLTALCAVYGLLSLFLSGGILVAVRDRRHRIAISDFFAGCASHFGRFFRLFFLCAAGALVVGVIIVLLHEILLTSWVVQATSEIPATLATGIRLFSLLVFAGLAVMVFDYARIDAVVTGLPSMRTSAWKGIRFVTRRLGRSLKLEVMLVLCAAGFSAAYVLFEYWIGPKSGLTIVLVVILQQAYVVVRMALRVFWFASESALYQELSPPGGGIPGWDSGHGWE